MPTKKQIQAILKDIPDPELGISVWELGLIYGIEIDSKKGEVTVRMTLTSIGCPLFNLISDPVKEKISKLPGVKTVTIDLTFEPPWNPDKMSKTAKMEMGMM